MGGEDQRVNQGMNNESKDEMLRRLMQAHEQATGQVVQPPQGYTGGPMPSQVGLGGGMGHQQGPPAGMYPPWNSGQNGPPAGMGGGSRIPGHPAPANSHYSG